MHFRFIISLLLMCLFLAGLFVKITSGSDSLKFAFKNAIPTLEEKLDSLERVFESMPKDTAALYVAELITNACHGSYPQKDLKYCKIIRQIAEQINFPIGLAIAEMELGSYYFHAQEMATAADHFNSSLDIAKREHSMDVEIQSMNYLVAVYTGMGNFEKAMEYSLNAEELAISNDDHALVAEVVGMRGYIYSAKGDFEQSLKCHLYALTQRKLDDERGYPGYNYTNVGEAYGNLDNLDSSIYYLTIARDFFMAKNDVNGMIEVSKYFGNSYYRAGELDKAKLHFLTGIQYANIYNSSGGDHQYLYQRLTDLYSDLGKLDSALFFNRLYAAGKDSLNVGAEISKIEAKYELLREEEIERRKEEELKKALDRRDLIQYSIILIGILFLFGAVVSIGFVKVSPVMASGLIFFAFLIFFEFLLVLADPYIEIWSGGAPGIKLLFNSGIAALIFPLHSLFETRLKARMTKN